MVWCHVGTWSPELLQLSCDHRRSHVITNILRLAALKLKNNQGFWRHCGISKLMDSEAANFWTFLMPTQHLHLGVFILSLMCTKPRPWASPPNLLLELCLMSMYSILFDQIWNPGVSLEFFLSLISHTNIQQTLWPLPLKYHQKSLLTTSTTTALVKQLDSPAVTWIAAEATEPGSVLHLSPRHPMLHVAARVVLLKHNSDYVTLLLTPVSGFSSHSEQEPKSMQ